MFFHVDAQSLDTTIRRGAPKVAALVLLDHVMSHCVVLEMAFRHERLAAKREHARVWSVVLVTYYKKDGLT